MIFGFENSPSIQHPHEHSHEHTPQNKLVRRINSKIEKSIKYDIDTENSIQWQYMEEASESNFLIIHV